MERIREGLVRAREGEGHSFLVLGPGGMGKTRMLRWVEQEARTQGFQVGWGYALKEAIAPFFVFQQIFRREVSPTTSGGQRRPGGTTVASLPDPLPAYLLFEEERPRRFRTALSEISADVALFVISRENPATLRERGPPLPPATTSLWISRIEGEGRLAPGQLDRLGEMASAHLQAHPGGVVALDVIEYLSSQNAFAPVLRLLQFLRDVAQDTDGHLLVALNPGAFEKKEVSLFESDAEVQRIETPSTGDGRASVFDVNEPPSETLLRYLRTLEASAAETPQLIVVDDLHWADAQSGTAFQFLCRNLRGHRVVLVGGAREDEIPTQAEEGGLSLLERLEGLSQEGTLARIPLHSFSEEEARGFAEELLGAPLAPGQEEDVKALVHRTGGNPYFLRETLLQLREEKGLRRAEEGYKFAPLAGGRSALSVIPTSLRRMVTRRLERLDAADREFLNLAAVAGSDFAVGPVAAVRGIPLGEAATIADRLERVHRVIERAPETLGGGWIFSHPLVWEVTIAEMRTEDRRRDARTLMAWWEANRPEDRDTLARLAHDTGDPEQGVPWVLKAFDLAVARPSPEAAMTYLGWLHDLHRANGRRPSADEISQEVVAARKVSKAGGPHLAHRFLEALLREPMDDAVRWDVRYSIGRTADQYDLAESRRIVAGLLADLARPGASPPAKVRNAITTLHVSLLLQEGKFKEAAETVATVLAAPPEDVDTEVALVARTLAVNAEENLGHAERAHTLLDEAEAMARGNPESEAYLSNMRAVLTIHGGEPERAIPLFRESARLSRSVGFLAAGMISEYNAAYLLVEAGRIEEAEVLGQQILEIGRKFELPRIRCSGAFILAKVELARGHAKAAEEWGTLSLRDAKVTTRPDDIRDCRALMAEIWGRTGDRARGIRELEAMDREGILRGAVEQAETLPILLRLLEEEGETERTVEVARRLRDAETSLGNPKGAARAQAVIDRLSGGAPPPERGLDR